MRRKAFWALALAVVLSMAAGVAEAEERPKIGLALSGGGARGAAHVGVIKVLEAEGVPIDFIAGTSMGAIVGGLYAAGLSTEAIERELLEQDWDRLLDDRPPYRDLLFRRKEERRLYPVDFEIGFQRGRLVLPSGILSGQNLALELRRLLLPIAGVTDFDRLAIPFKAVGADIETGEMVILDDGDLPRALRASMAIPGVFTPIEIDGRLLVDGGIANNLPVDVVRAMGADVVIAIDVSEPLLERGELDSLVGIANQALNLLTRQNMEPRLADADVLIQPDVTPFGVMSFERAAEIVAAGEKAARDAVQELEPLVHPADADALRAHHTDPALTGPPEPLAFVRIVGNERIDERRIRHELTLEAGDPFDLALVERNLERLYGMGEFSRVSFERAEENGRRGLVLRVEEKAWGPAYAHLGFDAASDFQGDTEASAVLNLTRTGLGPRGAEWRSHLRLGRPQEATAEFYQPFDFDSPWFIAPRGLYRRSLQGVFESGDKVAEYEIRSFELGADLGRRLGRLGEVRLGVVAGRRDADVSTGAADLPAFEADVGAARLGLVVDSLDSATVARRGVRFDTELLLSRPGLGADDDYDRLEASLDAYLSRGAGTFFLGFDVGSNLGTELPAYDDFLLGGFLSLGGYAQGELRGQRYGVGRLGYRRRLEELPAPLDGLYAALVLEAGQAWRDSVDLGDVDLGTTIYLGTESFLGPIAFGYGRAEGGRGRFYFTLGRAF